MKVKQTGCLIVVLVTETSSAAKKGVKGAESFEAEAKDNKVALAGLLSQSQSSLLLKFSISLREEAAGCRVNVVGVTTEASSAAKKGVKGAESFEAEAENNDNSVAAAGLLSQSQSSLLFKFSLSLIEETAGWCRVNVVGDDTTEASSAAKKGVKGAESFEAGAVNNNDSVAAAAGWWLSWPFREERRNCTSALSLRALRVLQIEWFKGAESFEASADDNVAQATLAFKRRAQEAEEGKEKEAGESKLLMMLLVTVVMTKPPFHHV